MSLAYYKRFPRDFLEGTIGLSFEEKGAYAIVLDLIYMRDGKLQDDGRYIAGQLGCSVRKWSSIRDALVSKGKLVADQGIISNFRADYLIENSTYFQDKQSENRSKPNKNSALKSPKVAHTRGLPESEPEPKKVSEANASSPPAAAEPVGYPPAFEADWRAYPHVKGRSSKPKALGYWRKVPVAMRGQLPAMIARYRREGREPNQDCGAPAFERWLRDQRFLDWAPSGSDPTVPKWQGPDDVRSAVVEAKGEEWAASWLDGCQWRDMPERAVVTHRGFTVDRLRRDVGSLLAVLGVAIRHEAAA